MSGIAQGYFTISGAAAYCAYGDSAFREYAKKFNLPRCGPKNNRYSKDTLDAFMANPHAFLKQKPAPRPRQGFTPVAV